MAKIIGMDPDQLRQLAGHFSTESGNVESVITNMDKLVSQMEQDWKGAAGEAFSGKYQELRPSFIKMKDLIDDISRAVNASAQSFEDTDTTVASGYNG
ncbi:MAG: WXG100 family type VII secretion target [Eubacteriaceae bacterium]|nr:WXG100 family type VII secretion target [Eubacteriaceae bacterium]